MYPRRDVNRTRGKTYKYTNLVESFRRPDGKPTNRIVANLGPISDQAHLNLKLAFRAAREGKAVIIADEATAALKRDKVKANHRYLDLAVMRELWAEWELGTLLADLIGPEETNVSTADVIEALTHQRCVAPRSKFHAQEWFPTTALPELMHIAPVSFNNTRIHRALDALYECNEALQESLPKKYLDRQAKFAAMFMDVTDTWFAGRGCESAKRARTKEGHRNKKCIGIVLLVNKKGYPLRWSVVPGKTKDHIAMADMIEHVRTLKWAKNVPLVCDRAMGQQSSLAKLFATGLHFLTAAHVDSIESYTSKVPWELFSGLELKGTERSRKADVKKVIKAAEDANELEKVDEHLFVMDLGKFTCSGEHSRASGRRITSIQERLRYARELQAQRDSGKSVKVIARELDITPSYVSQKLIPLRLDPSVQRFIELLPTEAPITQAQLKSVLRAKGARKQQKLLQVAIAPKASGKAANERGTEVEKLPYQVRLAAYFNPQMFVDQRRRARKHREELCEFVALLNKELAEAKKTRKEEPTRRKIIKRLEKHNYLELFDVSLEPIPLKGGKVTSFNCTVTLNAEAWKRRHKYNGFVILLAHPELDRTPTELAQLYRAKDMVEKDYWYIKSFIKLRPVFHYTDKKVEAHVSTCMLALLQERTLEQRLAAGGIKQTAARTIEQLATCHLNLMRPGTGGGCFYSITEPTRKQTEILKALGFVELVDDAVASERLSPRLLAT